MDRFGIYEWSDGRSYQGFYCNDKKHGFGIYIWADGKRYEGYWYEGKQHGIGTFTSASGKTKMGLWEDGKKLKWIQESERHTYESTYKIFESDESNEKARVMQMQFGIPKTFT